MPPSTWSSTSSSPAPREVGHEHPGQEACDRRGGPESAQAFSAVPSGDRSVQRFASLHEDQAKTAGLGQSTPGRELAQRFLARGRDAVARGRHGLASYSRHLQRRRCASVDLQQPGAPDPASHGRGSTGLPVGPQPHPGHLRR